MFFMLELLYISIKILKSFNRGFGNNKRSGSEKPNRPDFNDFKPNNEKYYSKEEEKKDEEKPLPKKYYNAYGDTLSSDGDYISNNELNKRQRYSQVENTLDKHIDGFRRTEAFIQGGMTEMIGNPTKTNIKEASKAGLISVALTEMKNLDHKKRENTPLKSRIHEEFKKKSPFENKEFKGWKK